MQGEALFEANVTESIARKESRCQNRCSHCWHDKTQRCICRLVVPRSLTTETRVKVLVLQHSKEYLNPGDDAKLLLALLPPERCALYVYGRKGDLAALRAELDEAPQHTLLLWPGEGALTVDDWLARLEPRPSFVPSHQQPGGPSPPLLRVLVLDGVYNDAAAMFRHLRRGGVAVPHVALHPQTLSVYRRAQHGYAGSVSGSDPAALRICTVEAVALLLEELGEPQTTTRTLVQAIEANNNALACVPGAGPNPIPDGRRARRRRREAAAAAEAAAAGAAIGASGGEVAEAQDDRTNVRPATYAGARLPPSRLLLLVACTAALVLALRRRA